MLSLQSIWKPSLIHFLHFLVYLELKPFQVHGGSLKGFLCLCLVNYDCFREGWRWDTLMLLVLLLLRSWVLFCFFKFYFLFDIPFFPYFPFDNIRPHQPFKQWAVKDLNDFLLLCSRLYMFWPSSAALTGKRGPCGSTLSWSSTGHCACVSGGGFGLLSAHFFLLQQKGTSCRLKPEGWRWARWDCSL